MTTHTSILRKKWLAGTFMGGAFCLCALAEDIPLSIAPAVHVTWPSATNKTYQIQVSTNLAGNWVSDGESLEGTGGQMGEYFETGAAGQFFRVQETVASGMSWLEGTWQGDTYQASSNSIPFTTLLSINNSNRSFSGIYSNNFASCSGTLDLLSYSDTQARFYSTVQSGPCVNGLVILTRVNTTNVLYNWYHPQGPMVASSFAVLIHK